MKAPMPPATPRSKLVLSALLFGAVALAGVLVVLYAWHLPPFHSSIESTENALVRGQVTIVSPQLSGHVVEVAVGDFQQVRQGDLIARLDDRLYQQKVDLARAQLAAATAAIEGAGAATDSARRAALAAAVASAEAAVNLAQADLASTRVLAPRDGQLGQVTVRAGSYVNAGAQLTAVVPEQKWIIANLKETQIARVAVGQRATFSVDALDNAILRGHVEKIAPATGSEFSVLAPDNATGNYVKIAQRIAVRISIDPNQALAARLRPGMSVVVNIDTARVDKQAAQPAP